MTVGEQSKQLGCPTCNLNPKIGNSFFGKLFCSSSSCFLFLNGGGRHEGIKLGGRGRGNFLLAKNGDHHFNDVYVNALRGRIRVSSR